jgi:hypothetical protein
MGALNKEHKYGYSVSSFLKGGIFAGLFYVELFFRYKKTLQDFSHQDLCFKTRVGIFSRIFQPYLKPTTIFSFLIEEYSHTNIFIHKKSYITFKLLFCKLTHLH